MALAYHLYQDSTFLEYSYICIANSETCNTQKSLAEKSFCPGLFMLLLVNTGVLPLK